MATDTIPIPLRKKYRRQGAGAKSIKQTDSGNGKLAGKAGKVSWKKGTGLGDKGKVHK